VPYLSFLASTHLAVSRIVIWGGGIFAPAVGAWFRVLEKIPIQNKLGVTVARVALDQLVAAPVVLSSECRLLQWELQDAGWSSKSCTECEL